MLCRAQLQAYSKSKEDGLLELKNTIAVLKQQLEQAQQAKRNAEAARSEMREHTSNKLLERGQVCIEACLPNLCYCMRFVKSVSQQHLADELAAVRRCACLHSIYINGVWRTAESHIKCRATR